MEFARAALAHGLDIFRNNVPIDTGQLQGAIQGKIQNDRAIIEVPNVSWHDDNAKKIAIFLNIGLSDAGRILMRSHDNQAGNTKAGTPTAHWVDNAIRELNEILIPIGRTLVIRATNKAFGRMMNG